MSRRLDSLPRGPRATALRERRWRKRSGWPNCTLLKALRPRFSVSALELPCARLKGPGVAQGLLLPMPGWGLQGRMVSGQLFQPLYYLTHIDSVAVSESKSSSEHPFTSRPSLPGALYHRSRRSERGGKTPCDAVGGHPAMDWTSGTSVDTRTAFQHTFQFRFYIPARNTAV